MTKFIRLGRPERSEGSLLGTLCIYFLFLFSNLPELAEQESDPKAKVTTERTKVTNVTVLQNMPRDDVMCVSSRFA